MVSEEWHEDVLQRGGMRRCIQVLLSGFSRMNQAQAAAPNTRPSSSTKAERVPTA